jgi:MFS family permease
VVAAATALPLLPGSLLAGTLVDALGRRRVAWLADAASALSAAAIPLVDATVGLTVPVLVALAVLGALFDPAGLTARETLLPAAADAARWRLIRVNGLREAVFGLAYVVGPGIGGVLVAAVGAPGTLWASAAAFAVSVGLVACVRVSGAGRPSRRIRGVWRATGEGLRFVWRDRLLRTLALLSVAIVALYLPVEGVILPALFVADAAPERLGLVVMAMSAGGLAGALGFGTVGHRLHRRAAFITAVPSGTGESTMSPRLALACDAAYLDRGAMYRAATLVVLRAGGAPEAPEAGPLPPPLSCCPAPTRRAAAVVRRRMAAAARAGHRDRSARQGGHTRRQADQSRSRDRGRAAHRGRRRAAGCPARTTTRGGRGRDRSNGNGSREAARRQLAASESIFGPTGTISPRRGGVDRGRAHRNRSDPTAPLQPSPRAPGAGTWMRGCLRPVAGPPHSRRQPRHDGVHHQQRDPTQPCDVRRNKICDRYRGQEDDRWSQAADHRLESPTCVWRRVDESASGGDRVRRRQSTPRCRGLRLPRR